MKVIYDHSYSCYFVLIEAYLLNETAMTNINPLKVFWRTTQMHSVLKSAVETFSTTATSAKSFEQKLSSPRTQLGFLMAFTKKNAVESLN